MNHAGPDGYPRRVDWFFTALLVITSLAATWLALRVAWRLAAALSR